MQKRTIRENPPEEDFLLHCPSRIGQNLQYFDVPSLFCACIPIYYVRISGIYLYGICRRRYPAAPSPFPAGGYIALCRCCCSFSGSYKRLIDALRNRPTSAASSGRLFRTTQPQLLLSSGSVGSFRYIAFVEQLMLCKLQK